MQLCKLCQVLPPVTVCLKGKLCFKCGNKCHGEYQHPVQFIRHCQQSGKTNTRTVKSFSILTTTKSLKQIPKRMTKINSKLALTQLKHSDVKTKKTQPSRIIQQNKQNMKLKLNKAISKIETSKDLQKSKKSIAIMAQQSRQQEHQQMNALKRKLAKQQSVIKRLCQRLSRERKQKQTMRKNYQEKLKFIRQLRQ